jgi:hypothetical protein
MCEELLISYERLMGIPQQKRKKSQNTPQNIDIGAMAGYYYYCQMVSYETGASQKETPVYR